VFNRVAVIGGGFRLAGFCLVVVQRFAKLSSLWHARYKSFHEGGDLDGAGTAMRWIVACAGMTLMRPLPALAKLTDRNECALDAGR